MNTNIEVLRELDELVEAARLLGATQAKKLFGCYTDEDRRFERAMYESIDKHRAALLDWEAKQPAPQQPAAVDEAMVERALNARYNGYDVACYIDEKADGGGVIRAALTAALEQQPAAVGVVEAFEEYHKADHRDPAVAHEWEWWQAAWKAALSQQLAACVGCEGKPSPENTPCAVCGQQPAEGEVVFIDGVGAGRSSIKSCHDGVQWIMVGDRVYWPLSDSDAKRLQSACCGNGSFDGPPRPLAKEMKA